MGFLEDVNSQGCRKDWGAQGKYQNEAHNTYCAKSGGRHFEILRALRCILGNPEAPFSCIRTVNTYPKVAIFV